MEVEQANQTCQSNDELGLQLFFVYDVKVTVIMGINVGAVILIYSFAFVRLYRKLPMLHKPKKKIVKEWIRFFQAPALDLLDSLLGLY